MIFTSTRDEKAIGQLRDIADCILERLQNEECPLAHHVRALSILIWLVENLEQLGISLDRQTRDEVEGCAKALTGEYLRRGSYNIEQVFWVLEWAPITIIDEVALQVPDSLFESLADVSRLTLMGLTGLLGLSGLPDPADLARLRRLPGLARLADLPGLARLARLLHLTYATETYFSRHASIARLALDETPESEH